MTVRGIISPRRSSRRKKTAPPNPEAQQNLERKETETATNLKRKPIATHPTKNNLRPSNSSGIHLSKSTVKIASSRRQTEQPTNPNTNIPTTKSLTPSNSNLKGGFSFSSSRLFLSGSRKYFDSPNDSPKSYRSLGAKEEFGSQSKSQRILFKIYMEIASHRQGNSSITSYFTNLKVLWDQLAKTYSDNLADQYSSDAIEMLREHMEREKVMHFLVGLNDSYSSICSKILLMRPFPTVDTAFSVIIRKERRRRSIILSQEVEEKLSIQND